MGETQVFHRIYLTTVPHSYDQSLGCPHSLRGNHTASFTLVNTQIMAYSMFFSLCYFCLYVSSSPFLSPSLIFMSLLNIIQWRKSVCYLIKKTALYVVFVNFYSDYVDLHSSIVLISTYNIMFVSLLLLFQIELYILKVKNDVYTYVFKYGFSLSEIMLYK